jgi:hypothetical protein
MLRSHLGKATGTLDGEPVEGLFMLDYIYSRPDAMWTEIGMLTKLHKVWLNWLVEYDDGGYEGGLCLARAAWDWLRGGTSCGERDEHGPE